MKMFRLSYPDRAPERVMAPDIYAVCRWLITLLDSGNDIVRIFPPCRIEEIDLDGNPIGE